MFNGHNLINVFNSTRANRANNMWFTAYWPIAVNTVKDVVLYSASGTFNWEE